VLYRCEVVNRNKMRHGKEEGYDKRAGDREGVGDHTKKVSKQNGKEKIE